MNPYEPPKHANDAPEEAVDRNRLLRILPLSVAAPATLTFFCILVGLLFGSEAMPWNTVGYWVILLTSWGAFAGGLYRASSES